MTIDKYSSYNPISEDIALGSIKSVGKVGMNYSSEAIAALKYLDLELYNVLFNYDPATGQGTPGLHWKANIAEGVLVAHMDDEDYLTLASNIRFPLIEEGIDSGVSIEAPGGGVETKDRELLKTASAEERLGVLGLTAVREFEEEAGIRLKTEDLELLETINVGVGFSNLKINILHATGGVPSQQSHDEGEAGMMKVFKVPLDYAYELKEKKLVREAATVIAIQDLMNEYGVPIPKKLNLNKNSFPAKPSN